jgi:ABC-type amino acid transport substrate-binding protein
MNIRKAVASTIASTVLLTFALSASAADLLDTVKQRGTLKVALEGTYPPFNFKDEFELYDLEKDPKELKSVYDDPAYADVVKQMKVRLAALRKEYQDEK